MQTIEKPITQILFELKNGEQHALDELLPLVYDELRRLANSYLKKERSNHTLQPTALVNEVCKRAGIVKPCHLPPWAAKPADADPNSPRAQRSGGQQSGLLRKYVSENTGEPE